MAKPPKKKRPPRLDPILPLPADSGIPEVLPGQGAEILRQKEPTMFLELSYRAFYTLWEMAEAAAKRDYAKYVNGPLAHVAEMRLEQVTAFRSAAAGVPLVPLSEAKAQKARRVLAKIEREEAESAKAKKKGAKNADETSAERPSSSQKGKDVAKSDAIETTAQEAGPRGCTASYKGEFCTGPMKHKGVHKSKTYEFKKVGDKMKGRKR